MDKKKICLLIPSLQTGGMERVMSELANYFATKDDIEVHLILYGKNPSIFYTISPNIIVHKPVFTFNDRWRNLYAIKTMLFLRSKVKSINPDTVLSFGEYWNSFVLIALFNLRYKIFVSDRCSPVKKLGKLHDFLRKKLYPKAAGVIVQTEMAKEIYSEIVDNSKLQVIANPIRLIETDAKQRPENIILSVGRLIDTKHHDRLINIFSKLNAPDWKLIIAGGDALKQKRYTYLKSLIKSHNLENKAELAGSRNDINQLYAKSKIFAFTSSSEGFPNVVGEALSAGLPVVSYNCVAGPSEMIVDGENGYLIPVFDDQKFQEKLQSLIENEDLRLQMTKKASESIRRFSIDNIGRQYLDYILS